EDRINDRTYETFYIKRQSSPNEIISLSIPQLGVVWHLVSIVKVFVYYGIVVLVFAVGLFLVQLIRGYRYEFTFRDKLLAALLVTAVVPLVVMATYGRHIASERLLDATAKRLGQETSTLGVSIAQRLQGEEGIVQEALSRYVIDQLATEAGADFNLYVGNQLQASSRPELYEAGILDRRLSGLAYANTVIKGNRFFIQTEPFGSFQYAVGYRPLVSDNGRIVGIVSVPTLYRLDELDEEIARQNALIFGVYAVVFFLIVIIATTFANRIAAPIHSLTTATKRVARGDMNVTVGVRNADGEIGELIRSFEAMTRELARSREDLVRFERELAWKEMAKQVAHEIKNPLTPMKLSLQHLRQTYIDRVANFEQVFDSVSTTIIEQIETLSRIASEFAHFARMPRPTLEALNMNEVLMESVHLFEQDGTVQFETTLDEHLPPVKADREELRRGFINIIRNGVQAMNNSGRMTIRSWSRNGFAFVAVRDHGIGMSDEVKSRLFQPNFSTKTDGMGLGLAITKKSIDDAGGAITVDSTEGEGTIVTVAFPIQS
ncbi:MAG: ATP-binding protein, partial [Bacteroidota bacterium]